MRNILVCAIALFCMLVSSCSSNDEQGIKDSRASFMAELREALTENNIPFRTDDEGYIRYPKEYKEAVQKIKENIDKSRAGEVGSKFDDEMSTAYFRKLLDERKIRFRTETREDGEWTFWHPENKEQEQEIEMKVVTHAFERQKQHSEKSPKERKK